MKKMMKLELHWSGVFPFLFTLLNIMGEEEMGGEGRESDVAPTEKERPKSWELEDFGSRRVLCGVEVLGWWELRRGRECPEKEVEEKAMEERWNTSLGRLKERRGRDKER